MENQEVTYLVLFVTIIFLILFAFVLAITLNYYRRNKKYNSSILELQYKREQEILKSQLEIQEQTLKNVSQELHDNIGQVLSLVKLNINTMGDATAGGLQEKINDSKGLISQAIQDLRDLSRSLNTDYVIEKGLVSLIEYEVGLLKKSGSFETRLHIEGESYPLEKQKELILFRITQEAIHNIIKHAKATIVDVHIKFNPGIFSLIVTDNGLGFDATQVEEKSYTGFGLGIRSMCNRAQLINCDFKLISSAGHGAKIILSLPVPVPQEYS